MMFYHDGLRIMLPKVPATAQFFGQPPLILFLLSIVIHHYKWSNNHFSFLGFPIFMGNLLR